LGTGSGDEGKFFNKHPNAMRPSGVRSLRQWRQTA